MARGRQITPTNIAIFITNVFKLATIVHKVPKDIMGECLHSTLRWPRRHVKGTGRFSIPNVEEAVQVFDYLEDPPGPQHQTPGSIGKKP